MTWVRTSVQIASFFNPRLFQEFVGSTTRRVPAWSGVLVVLISQSQPSSVSRSRVLWES